MEAENQQSQESESVSAMRQHLKALNDFLGSIVHEKYKSATEVEIATTKEAALIVEPVTDMERAEHFKLKGELRCLESRLTMFEDARVKLEDRLDQAIEREQQQNTITVVQ
jgi:hypothetical protein